jgi:hypothetical protein
MPWLALVAAIVVGRAIGLGTALRVLGWTAILLIALFAVLARLGGSPN